jgi:hypothetical protein
MKNLLAVQHEYKTANRATHQFAAAEGNWANLADWHGADHAVFGLVAALAGSVAAWYAG